MTTADGIWNRAAMEGGGPTARPGDTALTSVLRLHSLAMSGGLLDAVERLDAGHLDSAVAGYRWLGLNEAAQVVAAVRSEIADGALDDDERADTLEAEADENYGQSIPADQTIADAFEARLASEPDAFAAL